MNFSQGSTKQHQDLGKEFQLEIGKRYHDIFILPYTVGMFRDFELAERIIHAGQKGVYDWIVFGCGFYLFFDCKTGGARLTKEQKEFGELVKRINKGVECCYKLTNVADGIRVIEFAKAYYKKRAL